MCDVLDKESSLAEFDRNNNFQTNKSFLPIGAPDPWPSELSDIDDKRAMDLYEIKGIGTFKFWPLVQAVEIQ